MAKSPVKSAPTLSEIVLNERLRVAAILESPEGLRAPKMARELALRSPMGADQARALLTNAAAESPFLEMMASEAIGLSATSPSAQPAIGPDGAKAARLAEIKQVGAAFNASQGYGLAATAQA